LPFKLEMMARPNRNEPKVPIAISEGAAQLRSLRISSPTISLIVVIVLGGFIVSGDVAAYINQRREIALAEQAILDAQQQVEQMEKERDRWQDPIYIRAQARNRLYYVLPGEVSYLVMDNGNLDFSDTSGTVGELLAQKRATDDITLEVSAASENWVDSMIESVLRSALDLPTEKALEEEVVDEEKK
jgi:cell division protein FtsB